MAWRCARSFASFCSSSFSFSSFFLLSSSSSTFCLSVACLTRYRRAEPSMLSTPAIDGTTRRGPAAATCCRLGGVEDPVALARSSPRAPLTRPWPSSGCVLVTLGQGQSDSQTFVAKELSESSLPPPSSGSSVFAIDLPPHETATHLTPRKRVFWRCRITVLHLIPEVMSLWT